MKVKIVSLLLIFSVLIISAIGCQKSSNVSSIFTGTSELDWGAGITVENHTYLPMNVNGYPAQYAQEILKILDTFEKDHPELEITSWTIEKQQRADATIDYVFGIWVNHRPKR